MNHLVYYLPLLSIIVSTLTAFANPLIDVSLSDELELRGVARSCEVRSKAKQSVPRNEVYDFIDRMVAKKAIGGIVKNTRPYSHQEVADFLAALAKKVDAGDVSLSDIERKRLMHLMHLFVVDSPYPSKVGIAHLLQAMQIPVNIYCRRRENRIDLVSLWKRVRYTTQYPVALM